MPAGKGWPDIGREPTRVPQKRMDTWMLHLLHSCPISPTVFVSWGWDWDLGMAVACDLLSLISHTLIIKVTHLSNGLRITTSHLTFHISQLMLRK